MLTLFALQTFQGSSASPCFMQPLSENFVIAVVWATHFQKATCQFDYLSLIFYIGRNGKQKHIINECVFQNRKTKSQEGGPSTSNNTLQ